MIARCPKCQQPVGATVRRGGDLICLNCACTCESYGHCEICR